MIWKTIVIGSVVLFFLGGFRWYARDEETFPTEEMPKFWRRLLRPGTCEHGETMQPPAKVKRQSTR